MWYNLSRQVSALIVANHKSVRISIPLYDLKLNNLEVLRTFDDLIIYADIANPQRQSFLETVQPDVSRPKQKLLPISNPTKRKELV
jgi:hypothetical protein